ncbi:MAG: hypothetical protein ACJ79U_11240 [Myxococcales bacterium]
MRRLLSFWFGLGGPIDRHTYLRHHRIDHGVLEHIQGRSNCVDRLAATPETVYTRAMARLNLTLDRDTFSRLEKHARVARMRRATLAKTLIQEALDGREAARRRRKLATDYAAERDDSRELIRDLEAGQLELLD